MAKKEKTVLLFIVGEGKKAQELNRKDFEAHLLTLAGKKKLKLEKKQISGLLDLAIADQAPADEVPEDITSFFNDVIEPAYTAAKTKFDEAEAAAKAEENKAAEEAKAKEEEAKALVAVVDDLPEDKGEALTEFHKKFDLGAGMTQCVPRDGQEVSLADWVGALSFGVAMESGAQWIIGDSANALTEAGHEDVVETLADKFGLEYSTVSGFARTAKNFAPAKRTYGLSFQKYREIGNAKFEGDEKQVEKLREKLLKEADKEGLSTQAVRAKVRVAQGKADSSTSGGLAGLPHRYLILNRDNPGNSELVTEAPKKVEDHQTIIDMQSKKLLVIGEKDGTETREWIEFPKGK